MKDISKEQIFFLATLVIVGYLSYSRITGGYQPLHVRQARALDPVPAPLVPLPLDIDPKAPFFDEDGRDVFASPREWVPLDPVDLALPPLGAPAPIPPMTAPAADVPYWAGYRVRDHVGQANSPVPVTETPGAETPGAARDSSESGVAGSPPKTPGPGEGSAPDTGSLEEGEAREPTAAEREAELKKQWDWLLAKGSLSPRFGLIVNEEKWSLAERPDEDIAWRMLTKKGALSRPNILKRDRVETFGFAETLINRFHLERRELHRSRVSLSRTMAFVRRWMNEMAGDDSLASLLAEECQSIIVDAQGSASGQALGHDLGEAYAMLGRLRAAVHDREGERQAYENGLQAGLENPALYLSWGRFLMGYGLDIDAEQSLRHAVEIGHNNVAAYLALGEFLLDRGRGQEARSVAALALKRDLDAEVKITALLLGARAALFVGQFEEAEQFAERAGNLAVGPRPEQLLVSAAIAYARRRFDICLDLLEQALTTAESPDPRIHLSLGVTLTRMGRLAEARTQLQRAAYLDPLGADAPQRAIAFIDELTGDDVAALDAYQAAVEMDPDDPYGLYLLGHSTRRNGDLEGAHELLRRSLAIEGRAVDTLRELGFVSLRLGAPADALFYLEEARQAEPDDAEVNYMIGLAQAESGRIPDAIETFSRARVLREDWAAPLNGLAYCYYRDNRLRETQERLAEAARLQDAFNTLHASYAAEAREAIASNLSREQWIDHFAWRDLANEWRVDERHGVTLKALGAGIELSGTVRADQPVRTALWRRADAKRLVSFEAEIEPGSGNEARYGISLLIEKPSADRMEPRAEIALARTVGGSLNYFVRESENRVAKRWERLDVGGETLDAGGIALLRIERLGDSKDFRYRLLVNDRPLGEPIEMRAAKGRSPEFKLSIFADAEPGQRVNIKATMSRVVRLRAES